MMTYRIEQCTPSGEEAFIRLHLGGEVTLESAEQLKSALLEVLSASRRIVVDCSEAAEVDLSALQMLCAAHRTATAAGKVLSLAGLSGEAFEKTFEEAGFQRHRACSAAGSGGVTCLWQTGCKI